MRKGRKPIDYSRPQQNEPQEASGLAKKVLSVASVVLRWCVVAFLLIFALTAPGVLAKVPFLLAAVFVLPLEPVRELWTRIHLRRWMTWVMAIVLFIVGAAVYPTQEASDNTGIDQERAVFATLDSEPSETPMSTATPEPTPEITPEPTETPEPTATPEPTPEPTPTPEREYDYVLNTNTLKFHWPSCSSVSQINEGNKQYYTGTRQSVIEMGYEPCGRCDP